MQRPLLIIDGDNLAHRAYHSTPKTIEHNAIVGFFGMLMRVYQEEQPRGVFVAFDTLGVDTYRSQLWPPYQGGRVFDKEIVEQLNMLPDICRSFGFGVGKQSGYEADDIIASAVLAEVAQGGSCLIFTTDKDSYQLVSDCVTVIAPKKGTRELDRIGPREVVERFGVLPEQVPCYKALAGDSSDKIPGAAGIGPKAASSLLLRHGSLDGVLETWQRQHENEQLLMFREIVRMRPEVEVSLPTGPPDWQSGALAVRKLGLDGLADRVEKLVDMP